MQFLRKRSLILLTCLFAALVIIHTAVVFYHKNVSDDYAALLQEKAREDAVIPAENVKAADDEILIESADPSLISEKEQAMKSSLTAITYLQVLLVLTGLPLLFTMVTRLRQYSSKLKSLTHEIEDSNRKYVFNALDQANYNEEEVKSRLIANLGKGVDFIKAISAGNYDIQWDGMSDANRAANAESIAGELIRMRDHMKEVKQQDELRIWATEGLSKFGEIIRNNQDNFDKLSESLISNVVKYVGAKVGGLFILEEDEGGTQYLQLKASYAYDRKKFLTKRIELGEGLVGQSYLEGQTIHLADVPDKYVSITSGLGDSNPDSLLVVPLKTNDKIEGVLELASLKKFMPHEIGFIEKLGELLASSIVTVRTGEKTTQLLQISQEQSEEMRAQEEEMRQNMEELEATQEQMNRTLAEMGVLKENLEKEKYLLDSLMDNIPDSIYFKDHQSRFIRVSKYLADRLNATVEKLIGKSDFDFQDKAHAQHAYDDEQHIMNTREPKIDYVEQESATQWVSTTKMPLINAQGTVVGTFGISRDVSKLKNLEVEIREKEKNLRDEKQRYEDKIKMLEDKLKSYEKG